MCMRQYATRYLEGQREYSDETHYVLLPMHVIIWVIVKGRRGSDGQVLRQPPSQESDQ